MSIKLQGLSERKTYIALYACGLGTAHDVDQVDAFAAEHLNATQLLCAVSKLIADNDVLWISWAEVTLANAMQTDSPRPINGACLRRPAPPEIPPGLCKLPASSIKS